MALQTAVPFPIGEQSAVTQQLDEEMQIVPQRLKPLPHAKSHVVPSHVEAPFSGTGQASQRRPHEPTLALARHWPLQSCVPGAHMFMHSCDVGMHAPAHSC